MVDARVEVGVVADGRRKVQRALRRRVQHGLQRGLLGRPFGQQVRQPGAKRMSCLGAGGHERIERAVGRQRGGMRRLAGEQTGPRSLLQIEDGIADGHARACAGGQGPRTRERQFSAGKSGGRWRATQLRLRIVVVGATGDPSSLRRSIVKCFCSLRPCSVSRAAPRPAPRYPARAA